MQIEHKEIMRIIKRFVRGRTGVEISAFVGKSLRRIEEWAEGVRATRENGVKNLLNFSFSCSGPQGQSSAAVAAISTLGKASAPVAGYQRVAESKCRQGK
jgi:hypothetical protein